MKTRKSLMIILGIVLLLFGFNVGNVCYAAPNISSTSESLSSKTLQRYNQIPQEIRNAFEEKGWSIIITDSATLNRKSHINMVIPEGYILAGSTAVNSKTIYLNDLSYLSYESICHEMGHFFDVELSKEVNGNVRSSKSQDFIDIWNAEKNGYGDSYCISTSAEYFADAFASYIQNGADLKAKCPRTYSYVENIVSMYCASKSCADPNVIYVLNGVDYTSEFNPAIYYNRYPDLQSAFGYDVSLLLEHYATYGKSEGRKAN